MKQSMKESLMSGFVGKALIALVSLVVGIITVLVIRPGSSTGSGGAGTGGSSILEILTEFRSLIYFLGSMITVNIFSLVSDTIQAKRRENELELGNRQLELQNQQLELKNRQLELQQENQQSPSEE